MHFRFKKLAMTIAAMFIASVGTGQVAHADLIGNTITDRELFPDTSSTIETNGPFVVPASFAARPGNVTISIGSATITYTFSAGDGYEGATFNGSEFIDATAPFTTATVDASTTVPGVTNSDLSIVGGDLFANFQGVSFTLDEKIVLDVSTASAASVPEPASLAIFGAGLAALGVMRRKRKAG